MSLTSSFRSIGVTIYEVLTCAAPLYSGWTNSQVKKEVGASRCYAWSPSPRGMFVACMPSHRYFAPRGCMPKSPTWYRTFASFTPPVARNRSLPATVYRSLTDATTCCTVSWPPAGTRSHRSGPTCTRSWRYAHLLGSAAFACSFTARRQGSMVVDFFTYPVAMRG